MSEAVIALIALLPEHLLLLGMLLLVALASAGRGERAALGLALAFVAVAALAALSLALVDYRAAPFLGHLSVAPAGLLGKAALLALALPALLMARDEFEHASAEFPLLLLASLYGACLMLSADSFLTLFLGLEILSMPVYALVLLAYRRPQCAEAALKYLVLGGTATAMFLMGASLLYGSEVMAGGKPSMSLGLFAAALTASDRLAQAAAVLVLMSFFLKAAIVPLHAWAPDAYEAASLPVTAYMGVIVKAAVLLATARLFGPAVLHSPMLELVALLPLASIVWGNLAAMRQQGLRRMLAYSGIAHAGYLFFALLGEPAGRSQALLFYLVAYGLLNLLALAALPAHADDAQRDRLPQLQGLFHRSPFAALMIGMAMLSLAGIPPFPGFVAKFLIFKNVVAAGHTGYAVMGLVGSYLGLYFYLRVIQCLFMGEPAAGTAPQAAAGRLTWAAWATGACLLATLALVFFPSALLERL